MELLKLLCPHDVYNSKAAIQITNNINDTAVEVECYAIKPNEE